MSDSVKLVDRRTGDTLTGRKYVAGQHPPPAGVKVTMGQHGTIARADTLHGPNSVILNDDWLVDTAEGLAIFTDKYVHDFYTQPGEVADEVKPLVLG